MRRYIKSYRTSSNTRDTDALRDQFIRQLTQDATSLLSQLTQQFNQDLQNQSANYLGSLFNGNRSNASGNIGSNATTGGATGFVSLLTTGVRYLVSRPQKSSTTQETSRSQNAEESFRLSRTQQLAEAKTDLAKGDKNL